MHDELMSVKDILVGLNDKHLKQCIGMVEQLSQSAIRRLKVMSSGREEDVVYFVKSEFLKPGLECMVRNTVDGTSDHIDLKRVGTLQSQLHM